MVGPYNARVPQREAGQEPREDSPPSQPENAPVDTQPSQPADTGAAIDQTQPPETSTPHGEDQPKADAPRDEQGRFAPKQSEPSKPDPVKDAIDKLARKVETEKAPKQPEDTPAKAEQKPKDAPKAPEAKPTDEALKSRSESNDKSGSAKAMPAFSPEEMAALKQSTRTRIETLSSIAKEAREKLAEAEPLVQSGKEYRDLIEGFELREDIGWVPQEHIAGLVKVQAAVNRSLVALNQNRLPSEGDLSLFTDLAAQIDTLRSKFGIASPAAPAPEIKPFEGELPADLKDMVEIYGVDEKRVRLLAAMEGRKASQPAQPSTKPQSPPTPAQPPAQQPVKPRGVDMEVIYARKLVAELGQLGVQNPNEQLRVLLRHPATKQEVIRRFPGTTINDVPSVFDALEPQTRNEIIIAAHKAMTAPKVPSRPTNQPPPATTQRGIQTGTAPARQVASAANGDAVAAAIAHLARPE